MERCSKCGGVMLEMKAKKTVLPTEMKRQIFKCSRCGYYQEKQRHLSGESPTVDQYPPLTTYRHNRLNNSQLPNG